MPKLFMYCALEGQITKCDHAKKYQSEKLENFWKLFMIIYERDLWRWAVKYKKYFKYKQQFEKIFLLTL